MTVLLGLILSGAGFRSRGQVATMASAVSAGFLRKVGELKEAVEAQCLRSLGPLECLGCSTQP